MLHNYVSDLGVPFFFEAVISGAHMSYSAVWFPLTPKCSSNLNNKMSCPMLSNAADKSRRTRMTYSFLSNDRKI